MNRATKKLLAVLLAACMLLALLPAAAIAEEGDKEIGRISDEQPNYGYRRSPDHGSRAVSDAYARGDMETYYSLSGISPKRDTLPSSYNSNTLGYVTSVKNQNPYGSCWAHAAMACVESYMIKHGVEVGSTGSNATTGLNLSETQHCFFNYSYAYDAEGMLTGDKTTLLGSDGCLDSGGNGEMSAYTLQSWVGAANEGDDTALTYGVASTVASSGLDSKYSYQYDICHVQNSEWIPGTNIEGIKRAIMEYGAGNISYYETGNAYTYTCTIDTTSQESSSHKWSNHAITLVGWDDSIAASNFKPNKPSSPGAWICKNSWGTSYFSQGYTYISYEDTTVLEGYIYFYDAEPIDNYDHNYQYDGTCNPVPYGSGNRTGFANNTKVANIFTAKGSESLEAVGFCSWDEALSYTLEIYKNPTTGNPSSGTLMTTQTGTLTYSGYYTIPLDNPVPLAAGDTFSVVFTQNVPVADDAGKYVHTPYDANFYDTSVVSWAKWEHANHGDTSYYKEPNGSWTDCPDNGDYRIKAYTKDIHFNVTAVSNNTAWGTVSVNGTKITATPAAGYYVAGYEVISGTATATINVNIINVAPESDCTIRIIFAEKPTYTVSYQSLGASAGSASALIYDVINLPASVSSVPEGWTFAGWTTAEVAETTTAPEFYAPGAAYTVTGNVTLYALFTRTEGTGNLIYRLVNDNLSDWSGNYIITSGKDTSMLVLKTASKDQRIENDTAGQSIAYASTGITLDGEVLRNVGSDYVFAIAKNGNYYTIKNDGTGYWIGTQDTYLHNMQSYQSEYSDWNIEYDLYNICMKVSNVASTNYTYLVYGSNHSYFVVNTGYTDKKTQFWKEEVEGVVYYHTSPTATPTPPTPVVNESQYVLVETAPSDWSGQYLIVYKDGPYAMDGSLTTLDVASNYKTVDLSDKTITVNEDEDIFYFTIAKDGNNYTLQSASGYYIGRTNNTNGLNSNTNTKYTVSLSINEEQQANIVGSGGAYLRFNKNNGEKRFRFFRSSTYTNQQPVYLYKYVKPEPRFVSQNLILTGEIGVQFFVDVSMLSDPSTAYMTFTIDDKAGKDGETLKVTTVPYNEAEGAANKRGFKFFVNAIQMADTITATLHYGDGQTIEKTYSVEQYIRDFEDNKAQYDNKTITLVEALCSYGYHVQQFLSAVNHWTLDTDYKAVYQSFNEAYDVNAVKTTAANNYRMTAETTGAFKAPGMSLVLDSETAIRIFLAHEDGSKLKEEDVTVNVDVPEGSDVDMDEITLTATQKGNRVMVEIKGIKAAWLAETFTITAEEYDTDNTQTITVCALSYIDRLLGSEAYANNTFAQNAVCALYAYAMAARAYNN